MMSVCLASPAMQDIAGTNNFFPTALRAVQCDLLDWGRQEIEKEANKNIRGH